MKTTFPMKNKNIVRLYPDDGCRLTSYKPETEDIVFFDSYETVLTHITRVNKFYDITIEEATRLATLRDIKIAEVNGTDGTGDGDGTEDGNEGEF